MNSTELTVPIGPNGEANLESTASLLVDAGAKFRAEVSRFRSIVEETGEFAVDTETSGLRWYKHRCVMIQVFARGEQPGVYSNLAFSFAWGTKLDPAQFGWLRELLNTKRLFMWNAKFDMHFLRALLGEETTFEGAEVIDGMVMSQMLKKHDFAKSDLKTRAREDLGYNMTDFDDLFKLGKNKSLLHYDLLDVASYAVKDPIATYYECKYLLAELRDRPENQKLDRLFHKLEKPFTKVLYNMERKGLVINTGYVEELYEEYSAKQEQARKAIFTAAGRPFNNQSQAQFCDILEELGFPPTEFRRTKKSNKRQLDEKAVTAYIGIASKKKLSRCLTMLAAHQEYASLQKLVSTYIIPLRAEDTKVYSGTLNKNGEQKFKLVESIVHKCRDNHYRVFPTFNQTKTRTGRLSCDNPNAQNWPRPNKKLGEQDAGRIRRCVESPRGYALGDLDYSQIELRLLGHASKEPRFIKAYRNKDDLHRILAAKMFKKKPTEVTDEERQAGKSTTSFGVVYGMSPPTLAREHLKGDVELAYRIVNDFFADNEKVHSFKLHTERFAQEHGYVETLFGRRRYLTGATDEHSRHFNAAMREAVNTVIQGSAADFVKMAMLKVAKSRRLKELGIEMIAQIHDELLFLIPLTVLEKYGEEAVMLMLRKEMEDFKAARKLLCPLVAEGSIAGDWYDAH